MMMGGFFLGILVWIAAAVGACLERAASKYSLNPIVLYAIVRAESGLNPYAVEIIAPVKDGKIHCPFKSSVDRVIYSCAPNREEEALKLIRYADSKGYSYSVGLGQINKWWAKKLALKPELLLDPCYNLHLSAYILDLCWHRFRDNWRTIDCYNKGMGRAVEVSEYTIKIYGELSGWRRR